MSEAAKRFTVVPSELPQAPYAENTKANGYKPEVDWQKIKASKTWRLCPPEQRNNLLRIWLESWNEVPTGSWENDDEIIASAIDMPVRLFLAHRDQLMRGWYLANDGRLYHNTITAMVLTMLSKRSGSAERVKKHREKQKQKLAEVVTRYQHGSNAQEQEQEQEQDLEAKASSGAKAPSSDTSGDVSDMGAGFCPHRDIIGLYHEILPELTTTAVSRWRGSQGEDQLRQRWREDARHQSLAFWERVFETVRGVPHWMGSGSSGFKADLAWIVQRKNFDKILNQMADKARREAESRTQAADAEARHG